MDFGGDIGTLQRRISDVPEGTKRRLLAFETLDLVPGLRVLEIGCGGGQLASNIAPALGGDGQYVGLDANDEQLAAARTSYKDVPNAEFVQGDATTLPFEVGSFDRIVAINTFEYIPDIAAVLTEAHRVLRPGGRLVNISVLWDHWQLHGADAELTAHLLDVFREHCLHQMLPLELPAHFRETGFGGVGRDLFTFLNTSLHENAFGYWAARVLCIFAQMKGVPEEDTSRFMAELEQADREGRFGFFNASVIHWAVRLP
jgi:SAM-dependent methyltransferase